MKTKIFAFLVFCLLPTVGFPYEQKKEEAISRPASRGDVAADVQALSDDVRKLSDDVKELIAILKRQDEPSPLKVIEKPEINEEPTEATVPQSVNDAAFTIKTGNDRRVNIDSKYRNLSLAEAKYLALESSRKIMNAGRDLSELDKLANEQNVLLTVEQQYFDLWYAYQVLDARKKSSAQILDCWRVAQGQNTPTTENEGRLQSLVELYKDSEKAVRAALYGEEKPSKVQGLYQAEQALRTSLGIGVDGAALRPTHEPTTERKEFEWNALQARALKGNVFLRKKESIAESSKKSDKLTAELKASELQLINELSVVFRNIQSLFLVIGEYHDCVSASEREITIYHERHRSNTENRSQLIDNIARAGQRSSRAYEQYFLSVAEYNKALAYNEYLCGNLTVGTW